VKRFLTQVKKAAKIGQQMRELGIRPTGGIRVNLSTGVEAWNKVPEGNTRKIADTFREAGKYRAGPWRDHCRRRRNLLGGMHSWRENVKLLEMVGMPGIVGLSGGHGAFDAVRSGRERRGGPDLAEGFRVERQGGAGRRLSQGCRRAQALDAGFSRGAE